MTQTCSVKQVGDSTTCLTERVVLSLDLYLTCKVLFMDKRFFFSFLLNNRVALKTHYSNANFFEIKKWRFPRFDFGTARVPLLETAN